jgi:molecular chaperone GrpE (heat shock protein)
MGDMGSSRCCCTGSLDAWRMARPHSIEEEAVATEAVRRGTLLAENASLRERLLPAFAGAENTRRRSDHAIKDARKFAIADLYASCRLS